MKPNDAMVGVGLRHTHFPYLEQGPQLEIDFFEAIAENFMSTRGIPFSMLMKMRERVPIALHGVSLSLAGPEAPSRNYLQALKELHQQVDPFLVSDHLCWTGGSAHNLHNLLPFAYTDETLKLLVERVKRVQDILGRVLILENVSAYFSLKTSTIKEYDFLNVLCEQSGCQILLDLNNIYVNSINQKYDAKEYISLIKQQFVGQIHLAGFSDMGTYLFDTHSKPVSQQVWDLFDYSIELGIRVPTLMEWDEDIPDFTVVEQEALNARQRMARNG